VCTGDLVRFGLHDSYAHASDREIPYAYISPAIAVLWFATLHILQSTDARIIGVGAEEYSRIVKATFISFGLTSIIAVLTDTQLSRGYLAVAFTAGLAMLLFGRWVWRLRVQHDYKLGRYERRVIVVGNSSLFGLLDLINKNESLHWRVVGICRTKGDWDPSLLPGVDSSIPMVDDWRKVRELVQQTGADTLAITGAHAIGMKGMRELSWDLEGAEVDIFVAPGLLDVAGPRMFVRPLAGMPLIHIDKPRYPGS